jgi:primosomal protein N'
VARAVRLVTEVSAVDRPFDYRLPDPLSHVGVGDRLRVDFHGRSVRAWVLGDGDDTPELKSVRTWLGYGPPPAMTDFLAWAARRWYAPLATLYRAATDDRLHKVLPVAPTAPVVDAPLDFAPGVWQLAPTTDPLDLVLSAYATTRGNGTLIVVTPTEAWAERLAGRLVRRGIPATSGRDAWANARAGWPVVVGARGTAFAPAPRVAGAVVLDADDDAYRSGQFPYYWAPEVLAERCRRDDAPVWASAPWPSPLVRTLGTVHADPAGTHGWPSVTVDDRRSRDPHEGVLGEAALRAAHAALASDNEVAVAVLLQRLGAGRLLGCRRCGELARCADCGRACEESPEGLICPDGHPGVVAFCVGCGATAFRRVRSGVTTLARDVALQLGHEVTEITAQSSGVIATRVVVGTEALLGRVRKCGVVIFVDADQYLTAPRSTARRAFVDAVGRAGRLVGSRREGRGSIVVQTRRPDDPVITAVVSEDLTLLSAEEDETAQVLGHAPYAAHAVVSGEGAATFVATVPNLTVRETSEGFVLRAATMDALVAALNSVPRPAAPIRVSVE